jgi:hypothetical protein
MVLDPPTRLRSQPGDFPAKFDVLRVRVRLGLPPSQRCAALGRFTTQTPFTLFLPMF